jgi:D-alanyl-D-alanine dipeptidase
MPFTAGDYAARMTRAGRRAREQGLAGLLVTPGPDLAWLTGYEPIAITERLTVLVLMPGRRPTLVVPALEWPDAEDAAGALGFGIIAWPDGADPYKIAASRLEPTGHFAISDSTWSTHLFELRRVLPDARFEVLGRCLPMLRAVKDPNEIHRLTMAGAAADATYAEIVKLPFAGRSELQVAEDLSRLLRYFGHERVDFTVVGSGRNGANPQHEATERVIRPGELVVLDFGGLMFGYGSDTTRTVSVGEPSEAAREVHEIVRAAQQAAFDAVRPGVACQDIDRVARDLITEAGYGEWFIHRTGHGIGVTAHEPPYLVRGEAQVLEPGMCFSIEPGIYLPGRFGVRIEDIVTVTNDSGLRLNNSDRGLRVVA